jgi:hypothetical protein
MVNDRIDLPIAIRKAATVGAVYLDRERTFARVGWASARRRRR